jgi:hypothetical protein
MALHVSLLTINLLSSLMSLRSPMRTFDGHCCRRRGPIVSSKCWSKQHKDLSTRSLLETMGMYVVYAVAVAYVGLDTT